MDVTCPIRSVALPGVPDLELQGLIVIIGPNSSGKTQLLHDVNETVCGRSRQLVVASGVVFRTPPPFEEYFNFLVDRGIIREQRPDEFIKRSFQYGADEGAGSFHKSQVKAQHKQFVKAAEHRAEGSLPEYAYLKELGPLSCSALFLKNRLTLMDACPSFDHLQQGPSKTLQSLYWHKDAKAALCDEITRVFRAAVWVDNTRHKQLVLRVSDATELPPAEDRLEPEVMEEYRTIETEGDGLRSYSAICSTLLLEQRPLCLVDEPEMCLHPPQAHAMGRFIGACASDGTCTVVATHSSHVLRGILETNPGAHVIRLTHVGLTFRARILAPEVLHKATSRPRSRSEAILEGLLSHAVVLCEAEGDRIVYESTYRTFKDRRLDVRFVPSEGTGGFADPLRLYRALEVPTAVIADVDFLAKDGELRKVLTELGTPASEVSSLSTRARQAISLIRACLSRVDSKDVQNELSALAQEAADLTTNNETKLRGKLLKAADQLYRLYDFKQRGLDAVPESYTDGDTTVPLQDDVRVLLADLEGRGLFLVPVGELESWLPILMKGQSREDKSKWAMLAAEKIEDSREREQDVWRFIHAVCDFLQETLESFATDNGVRA